MVDLYPMNLMEIKSMWIIDIHNGKVKVSNIELKVPDSFTLSKTDEWYFLKLCFITYSSQYKNNSGPFLWNNSQNNVFRKVFKFSPLNWGFYSNSMPPLVLDGHFLCQPMWPGTWDSSTLANWTLPDNNVCFR